jgi:hypothetical protein
MSGTTNVAIDSSGNVWATNTGAGTYTNTASNSIPYGNSLTVVVGAAGPVITPLSMALANNHLGQKP